MAHQPVTTLEELAALDQDLMVVGYYAGLSNEPDYSQQDKAYWHGFLNGQVDKGFIKSSPDQQQLARVVVADLRSQQKAQAA